MQVAALQRHNALLRRRNGFESTRHVGLGPEKNIYRHAQYESIARGTIRTVPREAANAYNFAKGSRYGMELIVAETCGQSVDVHICRFSRFFRA